MKLACLALLSLVPLSCMAQVPVPPTLPTSPPLPILAYFGPSATESTVARFQQYAAAGFNQAIFFYSNYSEMDAALSAAGQAGVKLFVTCPELYYNSAATAQRYRNNPNVAGYYLGDEPRAADLPGSDTWRYTFAQQAAWAQAFATHDPSRLRYVNLFPNYADPTSQLAAANYQAYLDQFVATVNTQLVSFDHYPVTGPTQIRGNWFENLERVAATARAAGKPFGAFALSNAHGGYPVAELSHLRLQVYSDLAYGAQMIQYFTYWDNDGAAPEFHDTPIDANGNPTPVYDRVKTVNTELSKLSPVFVGSSVSNYGHLGNIPQGAKAFAPAENVVSVTSAGHDALVSQLAKGNWRFIVAVNTDLASNLPLTLQMQSGQTYYRVDKQGQLQPISGQTLQEQVLPGDVVVVAYQVPEPSGSLLLIPAAMWLLRRRRHAAKG